MLSELKISNFAIADNLDIEFKKGLTSITGETGAGKSIMIDALALALGERADSKSIGSKSDKAQIIASFDIQKNKSAQQWLQDKSLEADGECIVRRTLSKDGKSRAFINGVPSPLQDLKSLAEQLVNIHSQHQHQQLLKKDTHRELLDAYSENQLLAKAVKNQFEQWQEVAKRLEQLQNNQSESLARIEFLNYQLEELDELNLQENEYKHLSEEHKKLANIDQDIALSHEALTLISRQEDFNALSALYKSLEIFQSLSQKHLNLRPSVDSLQNALIQVEECEKDLEHHLEELENNPERLDEIDQRLSKAHQLARKHQIKAEQLFEFHQRLKLERDQLENSDETLAELEQQCEALEKVFFDSASQLSQKRKTGAKKLDKAISKHFKDLGMENASIQTQIADNDKASASGIDDIEILIATNPGQTPQSLSKIASGGELSRISLAIQVNFAKKTSIPCLIFDEVDVGIGGATAEVVGKLLREIAKHSQVICITHLAQVAAQGQQHYKIEKLNKQSESTTQVKALNKSDRVTEIARMIGGVELTQKTQSHAKEMLKLAQ
jgi:DNA repair protein RecN (Recombination protein N)